MKIQLFSPTTMKTLAISCAIALHGCGGESKLIGPAANTDTTVPAILAADSADELIRESLLSYYTTQNNEVGIGGGVVMELDTAAAPMINTSDSADSGSADGSSSRFSDTNVQEQGVDESDRVKIDGNVLYALERPDLGYVDYGGPIAVDVVADIAYPYQPQSETLSAYKLEGDNSSVVSRLPLSELSGRSTNGMYLHKNGSNTDLVLLSGENFSAWSSWGTSLAFSGLESRISWVDASNPDELSIRRTMDIQGHLISSRKINNRLILVTRFHPQIRGVEPYAYNEEVRNNNRDLIANADPAEFMPELTISENGVSTQRPVIGDNRCYSSKPTVEQTDSDQASPVYPSPNIISIINIDLNNLTTDISSTCFVGDSETLYVSQQSVYLATTQYDYGFGGGVPEVLPVDVVSETSRPVDEPVQWSPPELTTEIHKFSFNGSGAPTFKGSGSVTGHLGWNPDRKPFRMSEKDGNLRVVTFDESRESSPVTLNILRESGGKLATLSTLPNDARPDPIGKPGESLYASRFIGDKAYLVTFRVTDPLYVLDVSNPNDPRIAGELEIPGYSDYLHPINDSLLVGLGKDAIADNGSGWGDGRGAWYQGVKLALYDVTDPANPFVADERIIGKRGTDSPALMQHHAFAYLQKGGDRNARLAFPVSLHNEASNGSGPQAWAQWTSNNMLTMEVDESSNRFVDVPRWTFETKDTGFNYSPVGLENDRAIIGADGGLYVIHNGTLHYGQWGNGEPTASVSD